MADLYDLLTRQAGEGDHGVAEGARAANREVDVVTFGCRLNGYESEKLRERAVAGVVVHIHAAIMGGRGGAVSRFSDLVGRLAGVGRFC